MHILLIGLGNTGKKYLSKLEAYHNVSDYTTSFKFQVCKFSSKIHLIFIKNSF